MTTDRIKVWDYLRFVTPVFVTIALFIVGDVRNSVKEIKLELKSIEDQIVLHLCNNTIHIPRETVVSRDEFVIYQSMRDKQMDDIKSSLNKIEQTIRR